MSTDNPTDRLAEALSIEDPADRLLALRAIEGELVPVLDETRTARRAAIAELRGKRVTWRAIGDLLGGIPANAAEQLG